jgi:site-specific DNA recombinase
MTLTKLRCATYARYSSDQQREASIIDQQRNMARYADGKGWHVLPEFVFSDAAMSGSGTDRPGLQSLLSAALERPKPFDVLLVDDTSRISRNLGDVIRIREQLSFAGIRLIAVSQGIDSDDEQSDVMLTVHGLVDSLYIKELAKKTHRGLEGLALEGFHTGGKCFGYRNIRIGDKVRLEIDPSEAPIVLRIFELAAAGKSLKGIAKILNSECVPPPRGSKRKIRPSWVYTAIREMLRRELYIGRMVWNKRKYVKKPGTNKRISIPRPESDWSVHIEPALRIIPPELWEAVQSGIKTKAEQYAIGVGGLMNRGASSSYLFSGLLKCDTCGSNLTIVASRKGENRIGYYGCPGHLHRGICDNNVYVRRDVVEERLLQGIRERLMDNTVIEYAAAQLKRELTEPLHRENTSALKKSEAKLRLELERLADAIAQSGGSTTLLNSLKEKEVELVRLKKTISVSEQNHPPVDIQWLKKRIEQEVSQLSLLLNCDSDRARAHLMQHVSEVRMKPTDADGKKFYVAEGKWLIAEKNNATGAKLNGDICLPHFDTNNLTH